MNKKIPKIVKRHLKIEPKNKFENMSVCLNVSFWKRKLHQCNLNPAKSFAIINENGTDSRIFLESNDRMIEALKQSSDLSRFTLYLPLLRKPINLQSGPD